MGTPPSGAPEVRGGARAALDGRDELRIGERVERPDTVQAEVDAVAFGEHGEARIHEQENRMVECGEPVDDRGEPIARVGVIGSMDCRKVVLATGDARC